MQSRRSPHPAPRLDRRALAAVAVLIACAAAAAHLTPVPAPLVPPVPPLPGDGGVIGSLMLLLPLYGVLRFVGRFGRIPRCGR